MEGDWEKVQERQREQESESHVEQREAEGQEQRVEEERSIARVHFIDGERKGLLMGNIFHQK